MNPALPKTNRALEVGIERGDHLGAQLVALMGGRCVADLAVGESRPGVPMRSDDLLPWMSAGKPITAVAVLQLSERGMLNVDDPIEKFIPEFGAGGKQDITIRHVLTHTGGFRLVSNNWSSEAWDSIIARICASQIEPGWVPGERAGYHVASGWFILGELVQRVVGRPYAEHVRAEIFEPLGMNDTWIGMPAEQFARYRGFDGRIAPIYSTEKPPPQAKGMVNTPAGCTECRPGANTRGPIGELARFYQMLLNGGELDGRSILRESTVRDAISRQRAGMFDTTFKQIIDWGLGVIINSRRYGSETLAYGFGPYASDDTFGHGGNQCACGLADPQHGLVVTWICNGMPGEARHQTRVQEINSAIYEDMGLSTNGHE
jgi:CubicO group peptidase (beta-lactamase class C family)